VPLWPKQAMQRAHKWTAFRWYDTITVASATAFAYALVHMGYYFLTSKAPTINEFYVPHMEQTWAWKRHYYLTILGTSFVIGLPFWIAFIRRTFKRKRYA